MTDLVDSDLGSPGPAAPGAEPSAPAKGAAPAVAGTEPEGPAVEGAAPEGRVTEIGAPEVIDRERHPLAAGIGVALLVLVLVLGLFGIERVVGGGTDGQDVPQVVVPRLADRSVTDAQGELERLGLIVDVRYQPNEVIPPEVVVEQEPIAGARLEIGEQVTLGVSDGPAGVRVPDLVGQTRNEASRLVSVLGLTPVVVEAYDENVPPGLVIASNPAAKGRRVIGESVEITISRGPEPRTVPELVGRPSPEAMVEIGRADLKVGDITRRFVADATPGEVLSTNPAAGAKVARDLPVDVVIAAAASDTFVPDLVGLTRASAEKVADELGIDVTVRTEAVTGADRRVGLVISQTPVADSPLAAMTIVVAVVPAPTTTTTPGASTTTTAPARSTTTTAP